MKIGTISYAHWIFVGVFLSTWVFLWGFWSVVSYPIWVKYFILTLVFLLFIIRKYVYFIKRFCQKNGGWILFILFTIILVIGVYYADIYCRTENSITKNSVLKYILEYTKGTLGTLIGAWVIYITLRPSLKIYPFFALSKEDDKIYGKVLIKNTNLTDLFDVKIILQGCFIDKYGNCKTSKIEMENEEIPVLRNTLHSSNENSYAWHTKESIHKDLKAFDYIRCRIIATHSLSGIHFITEKHFQKSKSLVGDYNNKNRFIAK